MAQKILLRITAACLLGWSRSVDDPSLNLSSQRGPRVKPWSGLGRSQGRDWHYQIAKPINCKRRSSPKLPPWPASCPGRSCHESCRSPPKKILDIKAREGPGPGKHILRPRRRDVADAWITGALLGQIEIDQAASHPRLPNCSGPEQRRAGRCSTRCRHRGFARFAADPIR